MGLNIQNLTGRPIYVTIDEKARTDGHFVYGIRLSAAPLDKKRHLAVCKLVSPLPWRVGGLKGPFSIDIDENRLQVRLGVTQESDRDLTLILDGFFQ